MKPEHFLVGEITAMKRFLFTFILATLILGLQACSHMNANTMEESVQLSKEQEIPEMAQEETVQETTDQQRIDDSLSYYQVSQDNWNEGRFDDALSALDQSYESILTIHAEEDPEIMQQKDDLRRLISKRIIEIYTSRSQKLNVGGNGAIPLVMNDYVKREIKLFQTKERSFFVESYQRSGKYRGYIEEKFREAGLPPEISWLPLIESGYKERAFSRARALGLWQFIASTGYRYNLKRDQWIDDRMDYRKATQAAIDFLTTLHNLFGDWTTALAGYNCGEGNVLRAIRQQRVNYLDNFWDLYPMLPSETARYVPRFLATLHIVNDPAKYGFTELKTDPPLYFDEVPVNKQMKLSEIEKALSLKPKTLELLNPCLRQKVTPDYAFTLRVPPETGELMMAKLDQIPRCKVTVVSYTRHRVRRGETLSQIARKYRTSVRTIAKLNRIRNTSQIRIGQRLKVPLRHPLTKFSSTGAKNVDGYVQYRVRRGDTLWAIAKRHHTTIRKIKDVNGLSSNFLHAGQMLQVPEGS